MVNPGRTFNNRAFVALVMALSGIALPLTGIANHFYGFAPMSFARHAWMSAHNGLGILFVVFSIWHVVLNRKAFWKYIGNAASRIHGMNRETVLASIVITLTLALFVGHAFHAGHR